MNNSNIDARWYRPNAARELLGCGKTKFFEILKSGRLVTKRIDGMRLIWGSSIQNITEETKAPTTGPLS